MIAHNSHRHRHCNVRSSLRVEQTNRIFSQRNQSEKSITSSTVRESVQQKHSSIKKRIVQKCNSLEETKGMSNKSVSREKILDIKIDDMLKQQEFKINCLLHSGNKIKFGGSKIRENGNMELSQNSRIKQQLICRIQQEDKQNIIHPNKQPKFNPNSTQKSNKLSLRHYINSTPAQKTISIHNDSQSKYNLSFLQNKKSLSNNSSTKVVLQEVRELKEMFVEFIQRGSDGKRCRKTSNWSVQSKQVFSLP